MMAIGIVPRVGSAASVTAFSTLTVTKTADTNDGVCDADCSLREAIEAASSTDNDEIRFAAGVTGTITLNNELVIDKSLAIIGPGANTLTVSGNNVPGASNGVQVFRIHSFHSVEISGLTIANGFASDEAGGILSYGQVNIAKCTISGNSARIGGGILNYGNMIIINSIISDNSASDFGGGIFNFGTSASSTPPSTITLSKTVTAAGAFVLLTRC